MTALRQPPLSRRLLGVLLLTLLLAQAAALLHGISHGISYGVANGPRLFASAQSAATDRDAAWNHAAGSASCRLVDQLLIGQATGCEPPVLPPASFGTTPPACLPHARIARLALRAYEARGPPLG